jgi:hypothetical protein
MLACSESRFLRIDHYLQAVKVVDRLIRGYNEGRLHRAMGFLRPTLFSGK